MWPWIKRWRDWAMNDLWSMHRLGPQPQALHYSYEKAGLTIPGQPIPWNAEAVVVEANLRLRSTAPRRKTDFQLRIPGQPPLGAEILRQPERDEFCRLFFRFAPPAITTTADLLWRNQPFGSLTLPVLSRDEFLQNLKLQMPSLFVHLGEHHVACQTFVSTQCSGLTASGVLSSPTSLVPLVDLGLQVEFCSDREKTAQIVPASLSSSQLADRQALAAVAPRRVPKRIANWTVTWRIGERILAAQRIRAISQRTFLKSLWISDTRFVVQKGRGDIAVSRALPPLDGAVRIGPCFLVASREPGMAGLCQFQVRAQVGGAVQPPVGFEQDYLITDGPTMVAPGTLPAAELNEVSGFELRLKSDLIGLLSLSPTPEARFTAEGGFKGSQEFSWTSAADEELNERLNRLLDSRSH